MFRGCEGATPAQTRTRTRSSRIPRRLLLTTISTPDRTENATAEQILAWRTYLLVKEDIGGLLPCRMLQTGES